MSNNYCTTFSLLVLDLVEIWYTSFWVEFLVLVFTADLVLLDGPPPVDATSPISPSWACCCCCSSWCLHCRCRCCCRPCCWCCCLLLGNSATNSPGCLNSSLEWSHMVSLILIPSMHCLPRGSSLNTSVIFISNSMPSLLPPWTLLTCFNIILLLIVSMFVDSYSLIWSSDLWWPQFPLSPV